MKRGVYGVLVLLLLSFSFVIAYDSDNFEVHNDSIETDYQQGDFISGTLDVTITDAPAQSYFESSLGGKIKFIDLLVLNDANVFCLDYNCTDIYGTSGSGIGSKTITNPDEKVIAFAIQGKDEVLIRDLNFDVSSDFAESDETPLEITFFDTYNWAWNKPSNNFDREVSYGCYNPNSTIDYQTALRSTQYCELMEDLSSSSVYELGADMVGEGTELISMRIENDQGSFGDYYSCDFYAPEENSCTVEIDEGPLPEGDYYVCINSEAGSDYGYKLNVESAGNNCGYYGTPNREEPSETDYPIFIKVPFYADSTDLEIEALTDDNKPLVDAMNNYMTSRYPDASGSGGDCSEECVFPILISGIDQNFEISNIAIDYSHSTGEPVDTKIYEVDTTQTLVDYEGILDIGLAEFVLTDSGTESLEFELDGEEVFDTVIEIVSAAQIGSLTPLDPYAGYATEFVLGVDSKSNVTSYTWDMGDGTIKTTTENKIWHTYKNISSFEVEVTVTDAKSVRSTKTFNVFAKTPRSIINASIHDKIADLEEFTESLDTLSTLQKDYVKEVLELQSKMTELNYLDTRKKEAGSDSEFVSIAIDLDEILIPQELKKLRTISEPFFSDSTMIDPTPLRSISSEEGLGDDDDYAVSISQWQRENIVGSLNTVEYNVIDDNGVESFLMGVVEFTVTSSADEAGFIIINKKNATSDSNLQVSGDYSYLSLQAGGTKTFNILHSSRDDLLIYVSPDISALGYEMPIEACNFNTVCDDGEDWKNCREDCKPWWHALWMYALLLILILALYTWLQEWYKKNYEKKLFEDRAQLFNLVNYIDNMHLKKRFEKDIRAELSKQGWSQEKINYAIKKSKGKNTGMYELIPVNKISSMKRRSKVKRDDKKNPGREHLPPRLPGYVRPMNRSPVGITSTRTAHQRPRMPNRVAVRPPRRAPVRPIRSMPPRRPVPKSVPPRGIVGRPRPPIPPRRAPDTMNRRPPIGRKPTMNHTNLNKEKKSTDSKRN